MHITKIRGSNAKTKKHLKSLVVECASGVAAATEATVAKTRIQTAGRIMAEAYLHYIRLQYSFKRQEILSPRYFHFEEELFLASYATDMRTGFCLLQRKGVSEFMGIYICLCNGFQARIFHNVME